MLIAAGFLIAAKFGLLVGGLATGSDADRQRARIAPPGAAGIGLPAAASSVPSPEPAAGPPDEGEAEGTPADPEAAAQAGPEGTPPDLPFLDPDKLAPGELAILQELAARRRALEQRERDLEMRAALLATAETRLERRLEELEALLASIEAAIARQEAREEEIASLVKIYATMSPKAAAAIFNRLEMPVLLEVVSRMSEARSSAIIARMDPARAEALTAELAKRQPESTAAG